MSQFTTALGVQVLSYPPMIEIVLPIIDSDGNLVNLKGEEAVTKYHQKFKTSSYHCAKCGYPTNPLALENHTCSYSEAEITILS